MAPHEQRQPELQACGNCGGTGLHGYPGGPAATECKTCGGKGLQSPLPPWAERPGPLATAMMQALEDDRDHWHAVAQFAMEHEAQVMAERDALRTKTSIVIGYLRGLREQGIHDTTTMLKELGDA